LGNRHAVTGSPAVFLACPACGHENALTPVCGRAVYRASATDSTGGPARVGQSFDFQVPNYLIFKEKKVVTGIGLQFYLQQNHPVMKFRPIDPWHRRVQDTASRAGVAPVSRLLNNPFRAQRGLERARVFSTAC
jgi:hypothetical protein